MMINKFTNSFLKSFFSVCLLAGFTPVVFANGSEVRETEYYKVQDGNVDPATFMGYNVYHSVCVGCHGVGGTGTESVPNLAENIKQFSPSEFQIKVLHKYAVQFSTDHWKIMEESMLKEVLKQQQRDQGELADMPRWEKNPVVRENVQNIYRYLQARSDGVIGEDKPGLLKD